MLLLISLQKKELPNDEAVFIKFSKQQQPSLIPLSGVGYMDTKFGSNSLTSKSFLMVSLTVFLGLPLLLLT